MANFEPKKLDLDDINGGIRFTESDGVTPNAINDPIEAVAYAQTVVEHLTDTPDTSEINGAGSPNVSFISSTTTDGVTIYKFKFSNLSGATFTPSLDEAGNLSWSNNRNLPNPPTINISGRDYLFSSEVLSGNYIPQVNSEVTDIPLTSFNRAPVDDIDHCYLFYYYTPENIYYWLATQVVDIQETTATLKILSVVRLTGYTPTIGENGNWFIGGEDTGKPSYGASGVTDVVAGASYNQDDFTITPLTFNFEVGNSKTVNVKAAVGNVEDGSYAKLAQVVRVDTAQSLTDEQKTQAQNNMGLDDKYAQLSQVVRTDSAQSLSEAQKQQGQANLGLDEKYAKQDGTYPNLSAGKATADGSGNNISDTYAKTLQVVRVDTAQQLTDDQKWQFSKNSRFILQKSVERVAQWKTVARIDNYGQVCMTVSTNLPGLGQLIVKFFLAIGYMKTANITQIGYTDNSPISAIRLRSTTNAQTYIDLLFNEKTTIATTVSVYFEANLTNEYGSTDIELFDFVDFSGDESDYTITMLNLGNSGINTTGTIYQQGSPVLVGSAPSWVTGTVGSLILPTAGWYILRSSNSYSSIFYFDKGYTLAMTYSIANGYVSILSGGTISRVEINGTAQSDISYYKLA